MKKYLIGILTLIAVLTVSVAEASPAYKLVEEVYEVQADDTLDTITEMFMKKNTYGQREFKEFRSGIIQLNFEKFKNDRNVHQGESLRINYWIAEQ